MNSEFVTLGDRYSGLIGEPQVLVVLLLSFNPSVQLLEVNKIKSCSLIFAFVVCSTCLACCRTWSATFTCGNRACMSVTMF